jgi:hypothetical protein
MDLFKDQFQIRSINPSGQISSKAYRVRARGQSSGVNVTLDVSNLYQLNAKTFTLAFDRRTADENVNLDDPVIKKYTYVMRGKVFFQELTTSPENSDACMNIVLSFGGLLCQLDGPWEELEKFRCSPPESCILCLLRTP